MNKIKLNEETKIGIKKKLLYIGIGCAGVVLTVIGFKAGEVYDEHCISGGLQKIWAVKPSLKTDMLEAIKTYESLQKIRA